jgi:serine/threonine-protein kinase
MSTTSEQQAQPSLAAGDLVGEYEITNKLGEGGMGVVYGAVHPEIGKRVAIKVLAPHAAAYPDLLRRFKEEARAVNKIKHPNIVDIFAFNHLPDGRHYFVMEYLEGESLASRLARGRIPRDETRGYLAQICDALQAAHDAGVIHRDLKPDNIWLCAPQLGMTRVKLLDFGIAKLNDPVGGNATQLGSTLGTPQYMSPEQGMGRAVDQRTDVYALGVILYQMFTDVLPFNGGTSQEIAFKHFTDAPVPPSTYGPIEPAGIEPIILDCLAKEPGQRPGSVRELGARIEAAFGGKAAPVSVASPRTPMPGRTEILPAPASQPVTTTFRGGTGEIGATGDEAVTLGRPDGARRRWLGLATAGLALAAGVGVFAARAHHAEEPAASGAASNSSRHSHLTDPPGPAPTVASSLTPDAGPPPGPAEVAQPPAAPEPAASEHVARVERRRPVAAKPAKEVKPAPSNTSSHAAAAPSKPDCNPRYYFDAQGEKHFKPECF